MNFTCLKCNRPLSGYQRKYCSTKCKGDFKTVKLKAESVPTFPHFTCDCGHTTHLDFDPRARVNHRTWNTFVCPKCNEPRNASVYRLLKG